MGQSSRNSAFHFFGVLNEISLDLPEIFPQQL